MKWFFNLEDDGYVWLRMRVESEAPIDGEGGMLGDAIERLEPGQKLLNLTYEDLAEAKAGTIIVTGDKAEIEPDDDLDTSDSEDIDKLIQETATAP